MEHNRFVQGFLTASLVFCVGPMTIMGSIQDGIDGNFLTLAIKSVLDGFAAMAFSATFGVGVLFSVITVFVFQGSLTLVAAQAEALIRARGAAKCALASLPPIRPRTA